MTFAWPVDDLFALLLASIRVLALLISAPIFGHLTVPGRARLVVGLGVVMAVRPPLPDDVDPLGVSVLLLAGWTLREVAVGLAIGFATRLLFGAYSLFGEIISIESGLGHARVLDPNTGATSVALASLFDLFLITVFLSIGGHHLMIETIDASFEQFPLAGGVLPASTFGGVAQMGAALFELGVRFSMPLVVSIMVSNLALGILARAVPQLNLMMLQLPAHVALGLGLLLLGAGSLMRATSLEVERWADLVFRVVLGA